MSRAEHHGRRDDETQEAKEEGQAGFTLVEILVVIIIIALLAAIAVPSFLSQKSKGQDAAAKSAAGLAALAMETYVTDHNGYGGVTESDLVNIEPVLADTPSLTVLSTSADGYQLRTVSSSDSATAFTVERTSSGTSHTCTPLGTGGCSDAGTW